MNTSEFWKYCLNILYHLGFLLIAGIVLFIFMWIYVHLKRWYGHAHITRNENNFKEASEYVTKKSKSINRFQRFVLGQTGAVVGIDFYIRILVFSVIFIVSILLFWWICNILIERYDYDILNNIIVTSITAIVGVIYEVYLFFIWIKSLKQLIKFARFLPFLFMSVFFACTSFLCYFNIKFWITQLF